MATKCFITLGPRHNLGRVLNTRSGSTREYTTAVHFHPYEAKWPSLSLKTWPKQFLGSLLLDIVLPTCKLPFLQAIKVF
jgi:hypothetical protein